MVLPLGRGVGRIRTPGLIRDYLVGQGPFAEDPPEELAQRRADGAYVAQIHQRVKQYIRDLSKELHYKYQWPRRHSFNARINDLLLLGLLVKTGEAAPEKVEPQERGAGQLGSAGGFSLKLWVRMAPGADTRPEWADLMGYIDKHYAEKALREGRPPPNIRPQRSALATALQPVGQAVQAVQRRRAASTTLTPEVLALVQQLEERRQLLVTAAEAVSSRGRDAEVFERLRTAVQQFHDQVLRLHGTTPFPDLPEALELLQNCVGNLKAETAMTQRRVQAINFCRDSAGRVAEAISRPLEPPETASDMVEPAPTAAARTRRSRRVSTEAPTQAVPPPRRRRTVPEDSPAREEVARQFELSEKASLEQAQLAVQSAATVEVHRQLELQRQGLLEQAVLAVRSVWTVEEFQALRRSIDEFTEQVYPHYRRFPLGDLSLIVAPLTRCLEDYRRAGTGGQMTRALDACRRVSNEVANYLTTPLPAPDRAPGSVAVPATLPPSPVESTEKVKVAELITARWSTLEDRIKGWSRPNSVNAANLLDRFVQEMVEAHPEVREDDLDEVIADVRSALEEYQEEEDPDERENAWEAFTDALGDADFSGLEEE